eukprot:GHUV01012212.1.p1 GENE.GHUV01012212.1~~GHUV01012212.1.p1  ORF type:complete len:105 (+),score=2.47 GHUV01012212.1:186-500(+)
MGNVKDATDKAQTALDKGIEQAATSAKTGLASAASVARDFLAQVEAYWDTAKVYRRLQQGAGCVRQTGRAVTDVPVSRTGARSCHVGTSRGVARPSIYPAEGGC